MYTDVSSRCWLDASVFHFFGALPCSKNLIYDLMSNKNPAEYSWADTNVFSFFAADSEDADLIFANFILIGASLIGQL